MAGDSDMKNMQAHAQTYDRVIALLKWGAVACACIALAVILIISR